MINLLSEQRRQIVQAACTLSLAARAAFIHDVEAALSQYCPGRAPSNMAVQRCIELTLDAAPWPRSTTSLFMCDSIPKQEATSMSNFDPKMAARVRAELEDDDNFEVVDGTRVLKDGKSLVVPLFCRDGTINNDLTAAQLAMAQKVLRDRAMATRDQALFDAGERRLAQPGWRHNTTNDAQTRDALRQSYVDYETELAVAYLNPHSNENTGFGSRGPAGTGQGTVGSSCTINGKRGTLQYVAGSSGLTCIPDDEADDWADGLSDAQIAREEYLRDLTSAWRNPTADVLTSDQVVVRRPDLTKDSATVARDHQQTMSRLYAQLDSELSEKWRGNR